MINNITVNFHASIKIKYNDKNIYFDPYKIKEKINDADYIFITHSHYDHYSKEDILKIINSNTKIIVTNDLKEEILNLDINDNNILIVEPNNEYKIDDIYFKTIPSYNIGKDFHKKTYNWVGYLVYLEDVSYYIPGDTDVTDEFKDVICDVLFVPVGGTYTMDYKEAISAVNNMNVKYAIPIHYGLVGSKDDAINFVNGLKDDIKGVIL